MTSQATIINPTKAEAGRGRRTLEAVFFAAFAVIAAVSVSGSSPDEGTRYVYSIGLLTVFLVGAGIISFLPAYRIGQTAAFFSAFFGAYLVLAFAGVASAIVVLVAGLALASAVPSIGAFVRGRRL